MGRTSFADRVFFGMVALFFLVLGVVLVIDSAKNEGDGIGSSFRVIILGVAAILGLRRVLRNRGDSQAENEAEVEEL